MDFSPQPVRSTPTPGRPAPTSKQHQHVSQPYRFAAFPPSFHNLRTSASMPACGMLPHCAGNSWRGSEIADCYLLLPTQFRIQPRRPRACDFPSAEIMPAATTPIMPERQAFRSIDPKRVSPYKTDLACRDHHTHTPLTPLHGLPWSRPRKARSPNPVIGVRDREDGIGSWPFTYFLLPSINQSIIPSGENARDFGRPCRPPLPAPPWLRRCYSRRRTKQIAFLEK
ncbi:hypothetical protein F4860DRAFT_164618 [Xylaria cubensis]|nr:hypothetical protein F4860DRAFT_164618 [Xylaria cubensis]